MSSSIFGSLDSNVSLMVEFKIFKKTSVGRCSRLFGIITYVIESGRLLSITMACREPKTETNPTQMLSLSEQNTRARERDTNIV